MERPKPLIQGPVTLVEDFVGVAVVGLGLRLAGGVQHHVLVAELGDLGPAFWQFIIRGLVLIIAVYIDVATKKNR